MEAVLVRIEDSVIYSPFTWLSMSCVRMAGQVGSTRDTRPILDQKCPPGTSSRIHTFIRHSSSPWVELRRGICHQAMTTWLRHWEAFLVMKRLRKEKTTDVSAFDDNAEADAFPHGPLGLT